MKQHKTKIVSLQLAFSGGREGEFRKRTFWKDSQWNKTKQQQKKGEGLGVISPLYLQRCARKPQPTTEVSDKFSPQHKLKKHRVLLQTELYQWSRTLRGIFKWLWQNDFRLTIGETESNSNSQRVTRRCAPSRWRADWPKLASSSVPRESARR